MKTVFFLFILPFFINASFIGNTADPHLYKKGLLFKSKRIGIKGSYVFDSITKGRYEDRFKTLSSAPSHTKLRTHGGMLSINLFNYTDIYAMAGNTTFQLDQMIFSSPKFSWSAGIKSILFKWKDFYLGFDGKYFRTEPDVNYFIIEKEDREEGNLAPVKTDFHFLYHEIQGCIALSYKIKKFIPYIGATYLHSPLEPIPSDGLLQIPGTTELLDFQTKIACTRRNWGMVIGTTLLAKETVGINLEGRFFDQTGFNIIGQIRF